MMKGSHGQSVQLYDINWGVLDQASHVPQIMSHNLFYNIPSYTNTYKHAHP